MKRKRKPAPRQIIHPPEPIPHPHPLEPRGIDWLWLLQWLGVALLVLGFIILAFFGSAHAQTAALTSADIDAPPAKYDYPYKGDVAIYHDLDPAGRMWGWTDTRQLKKGICIIHTVPYGTVDQGEVMDEDAYTRVLRHENGHCNGWVHR